MSDAHARTRPARFREVHPPSPAPAWLVPAGEPVAPLTFRRVGPPPPASLLPPSPPETARVSVVPPPPVPAAIVEPEPPPPPAPSVSPPAPPPAPVPARDAALDDALRALATARDEVVARTELELLALAVELAGAIVEAELETRPALHRHLLDAALTVLGSGVSPRVRVAPDAFDAMSAALGGRSFEHGGRKLELEIDATLSGTGVVLEAGETRVDGLLGSRLARVREALVAARRTVVKEAA